MAEIFKIEPRGRPIGSAIEELEHSLRACGIPASISKDLLSYAAELYSLWEWPSQAISVAMPENLTEEQRAQIAAATRLAFSAYNIEVNLAKHQFILSLLLERFKKSPNP